MNGNFSLLEWEFIDMQVVEPRITHVVIDYCWKQNYDLMFTLIQVQTEKQVYVNEFVCLLTFSSSVS